MNFYFIDLAWRQATVMAKTPLSSWPRERLNLWKLQSQKSKDKIPEGMLPKK